MNEANIKTISDTMVDLANPDPTTLHLADIAWGLGRQPRYNGHMVFDHTVAHHSIIMSHFVSEEYAMEALLHDAAESYYGDIVWPVKHMFPEIAEKEAELSALIMRKFAPDVANTRNIKVGDGEYKYVMSPAVAAADASMFYMERYSFGDKELGEFDQDIMNAWSAAIEDAEDLWAAPHYVYLMRYHELKGTGMEPKDIIANASQVWHPKETLLEELTEEQRNEMLINLSEAFEV